MAEITLDEREAMISEMDALLGLDDDLPPDAVTARQYADEHDGLNYDQAKGLLNRGIKEGKLQRKKALRANVEGNLVMQWVYWIA